MAPIAYPSQQPSPVQSNLAVAMTTGHQEKLLEFSSFPDHFSQLAIGSIPAQGDAVVGYGCSTQYFVYPPAETYQTQGVPTTMIHYVPSSAATPVTASGDRSGRTSGVLVYVPTSYAPATVDLIPKYSPLLPAWTSLPVTGVPVHGAAAAVPLITSAVSTGAQVFDYAAASNTYGGVAVVPANSALDAVDYQHEQRFVPLMLFQNPQQPSPGVTSVASSVTGSGLATQSAGNPFINTTNMQQVWHGTFDQHFYSYLTQHGDLWQLAPVSSSEESESIVALPGVKTINDSAKVRFLCKGCGNPWTSMKGKVIFWVRLERCSENEKSPFIGNGTVRFKLFGQRCQKCSSESYENAMWYPEEVVKVIKNLFFRIGQTYYGFKAPVADVTRRPGRPRTQHNSSYCQACAEGICHENVR